MNIISQQLNQQQQQQQQSANPRSYVVSVRSEIIRLVKFLGQFYNEQKELQNLCEDIITMSKESLIQLERLLQQTALLIVNQQYQLLQVQDKIELLTSLKLWSQKAQYVRATQIGSSYLDLDMNAYEQFLALKRQQGLENQKQRLIYKLFLKSQSNNNNIKKSMGSSSSNRRVLPTVPAFDEVDIQQQQQQQQSQEQLLCFDSFEFLSQSQEDSKSTAITNQETPKLQANYACVGNRKQSNDMNIQVVSRILNKNNNRQAAVKKIQKQVPRFQAKQFDNLEENLISCLDKMNISNENNSNILKSSLVISAAISQDKVFLKNKQFSSLIGAIVLAAAQISNIFVSINSIADALNTKERLISKVFQQLQVVIPKENQMESKNMEINMSKLNSPLLSDNSQNYQNMEIQVC